MRLRKLLLLALIFPGVFSAVASDFPTSLDRPLTDKGFVSVHYPEGFDATKTYSVLFWFHGTGGRPNPGIGRGHERFVTVGMSYLKREHVPAGKYGASHWKECLEVRSELEKFVKLDRNVVAGMSKGGWMSFFIAAEPREGLHAVGIFAAGKDPNVKTVPSLAGRELSVLVGTGETDPNFPQAQLAVQVLKEAGAGVFYEEWLGEGHTYHRDGRVRDWLDVESRRSEPNLLQAFCNQAVEDELQLIDAMEDEGARYIALRLLAGDPRLREAGEVFRKRVREAGMELAQGERVKDWLAGRKQLQSLVAREVEFFDRRDFDVSKLDKLVAAYQRVLEETTHSDLSARAAFGYRRAAKMAKIYKSQMEARKNPEYQKLMEEYVKLQTKFGEANGEPGDAVVERLKEVGARLGELRHQASMGAFLEVERGSAGADEPEEVAAAIEKGNRLEGRRAFGGLAF